MRTKRRPSPASNAEVRFQIVKNDVELKRIRNLIYDKRIHLDPIIFRAKFDSMAQNMFTAYQQGGYEYCTKFVDELAEFSLETSPFLICCDESRTQYVPSLLVSMMMHPPNNETLFSVLRCLSSITVYSTSKKFSKPQFILELLGQIAEPAQFNPSPFAYSNTKYKNDPPSPAKIQLYCLNIILNLIKHGEIEPVSLLHYDIVPPLFTASKTESAPEAMKLIQKLVSLDEINPDMIRLAYQTFHNYCNSPKSSFQIAAFDGISAIANNHPEFFDTADVSTPIVEAYDKIKSIDDTVAIAALALIGSLLGTGNDLIIGSIFSMFDWSILTEIWNISSSDQKQIICEFINTAINASPIELSNALTNGVFSTLLCDFPSTDCNLKAESLLPVISATNINPNAMLPIIIENGLIKVAGTMMEAVDDRYIQCGLQLIAALMNANFSNHELQELVKRDITDNSIESDVEALASGTQYADIASEVSTELNHFMEEE